MVEPAIWRESKRRALARLTLAQRAAVARADAERTLARTFDESQHPRAEDGKFTDGGGGSAAPAKTDEPAAKGKPQSSAAKLYKAPSKTADEIVAEVPGAKEAVASVRERLSRVVETNKPVAEGGFKQPDGSYTPERRAVHQKIIDEYINPGNIAQYSPAQGEKSVLTVIGGRGGSGKSWLTGKDGPVDTSETLVIDNDEVKSKLPEYAGWNAAQLHEEASDIVALIDRRAAALGLNVTLDGTLKSTSILKRIEEYQAPPATDYELEGYYMYASPETAAKRALGRFATKKGDFSGRFVPPEVVLSNTKNEANFDELSSGFRKWAIYDNDKGPGGAPRLYQQGGRRD